VSVRHIGRALLIVLVLLAGVELVLRAVGLGDPQERFALHAGLNDFARYLAPDELVPGGWRTQIFGNAGQEVHIPPRDGRVRVLLLGGANTSAMPDERLAAALDAAQPGRAHEVVNLGRPGYGSERVLILLRQALQALRPDVVVVRCGHGEFVEPGFGAALAAGARPEVWNELRLVNLVAELFETDPTRMAWAAGPEPEERRTWPVPSPIASHATARRVYDAYRFHLQSMVRAARSAGARLVLCTVASNMLFYPAVSAHLEPLAPGQQAEFDRLRESAYALLPRRLVAGLLRIGPDWPALAPGWELWGEKRARLEGAPTPRLVIRAPPMLRALGAPFDHGPLWPPAENWDPRLQYFMVILQAFHERQLCVEERAAVEQAAAAFEHAVALSPGHAHAAFELGLCRYLLGDDEGAVQLLRRAECLDLRPNRGNDLTNDIVREVASEPGVALVDVDALVAGACPGGLVGFELIMDSCTLQPGARAAVAEALVPAIVGD
jgi:hypothetical protein